MQRGLRMLARIKLERSWEFGVAGALLVVYAIVLAFSLYRQ